MKDEGRVQECIESCVRLGININENDIDHDLERYRAKCEQAAQGSNGGRNNIDKTNARNNTYKVFENPLYNPRPNDFPYNNIPLEHQHNHPNNFPYPNLPPEYQHNQFNTFTYQNHFQPQNQFSTGNNNVRPNYGNFFQGGYRLMNTECIR